MGSDINIILIFTIGFALASLFGFFAKKLRLPTLIGYLLAGYLIGPSSPGYVADAHIAEQLAEIGVILMLFSVGLHFKLSDLLKVRRIAIPGAVLQTTGATLVTVGITHLMGWSLLSGIIMGLTIGVASTFVMAKALADHHVLDTTQGHIAIGWLVVEDIFTVVALVVLPIMATPTAKLLVSSTLIVFTKFFLLCLIAFTVGQRIVTYVLTCIAQLRSQELFMLTVLTFVFLIATTSFILFGTSLALGAFIAGMVIGKTNIKYQAAIHSISLKDIFTIIFFLSVGMLLDPFTIIHNLPLFFSILGIILLVKPIIAFILILCYRLPTKIGLTVSFALAQIGEFSFILAEQATRLGLFPQEGYDIVIGCAIASISLNPLLFNCIEKFDALISPLFRPFIKASIPQTVKESLLEPQAIVVGFGPIGHECATTLKKLGYSVTVLEHNMNTVSREDLSLRILYGDASFQELLEPAGVCLAKLLVITSPDIKTTKGIIHLARLLNTSIKILARIPYMDNIPLMEKLNVHYVCTEKETFDAFQTALHSLDTEI